MGHSVRVRREEEKGTISWKIKFRNGTTKDFVSPITTKPWGKFIPKLADGDKPNQGEINSQRLYTEPEGLNIDGNNLIGVKLPKQKSINFPKGIFYKPETKISLKEDLIYQLNSSQKIYKNFKININQKSYTKIFNKFKKKIRSGETYQIKICTKYKNKSSIDLMEITHQ